MPIASAFMHAPPGVIRRSPAVPRIGRDLAQMEEQLFFTREEVPTPSPTTAVVVATTTVRGDPTTAAVARQRYAAQQSQNEAQRSRRVVRRSQGEISGQQNHD